MFVLVMQEFLVNVCPSNARVCTRVLSLGITYCYTFSSVLASQLVLTPAQEVAEELPAVVSSRPLGTVSPWRGQPGPAGDQVLTVAVGTAKSVSVSPVPVLSQGAFLPA